MYSTATGVCLELMVLVLLVEDMMCSMVLVERDEGRGRRSALEIVVVL